MDLRERGSHSSFLRADWGKSGCRLASARSVDMMVLMVRLGIADDREQAKV